MTGYAELHAHSCFSFLDGGSTPEEMVDAATRQGLDALALTDHDNLCGALVFAQAAHEAGLRPITGAEVTAADGHGELHLTLLAESAMGYANLCRLLTRSHDLGGRTSPSAPLGLVAEHAEGLVCLTGCPRHGALAGAPDRAAALERGRLLREAFGRERLRVEVTRPFWRDDRLRVRRLTELARELDLPLVATNDAHVHHRRRGALQDALVAIRLGLPLEACEPQRRGNREHVLKGPAEMTALFADLPEAVRETVAVAERCRFDLTQDLGYRYPSAGDEVAHADLTGLCRSQLELRYRGRPTWAEAERRLAEELDLIRYHRLSGFFLLHHEILEMARTIAVEVRGAHSARMALPPGRGRGSSVGSIVCYLTGLSHVDPVDARLSLGRFLNRELAAVPDIDLDFPRDIRERLIVAVHERYGYGHSALIGAFATYRARGAIRELGKVLGLPPPDIDRLARASDGFHAAEVGEEIRHLEGLAERAGDRRWKALAHLSAEIAGLPRHLSQHSGGMIVSTGPLDELVPLVPAAWEGRQLCQWDKDSCADAGFLKIDLLGLGMLSAVEECIDLVARSRGETLDLSRIDLDDPGVYGEIQDADTVGVFQIESRAQMQMLLRTRPSCLDDLTVEVALVRPGPIQGGAVHPYIERRTAQRLDPGYEPPYDHPLLAGPLEDTLGVIVFQDQVLDVAMALAGFSAGQAEGLRRAMSRRRSREALASHWEDFRDGAASRGVPVETAEDVFEKILAFSAFGFPKSHAAAFGLLAYQSAWLHRAYPAEFLCSLLNAQPMGFYPPASLIRDAERRDVVVRGVDVNRSDAACTVEDGGRAVRVGIGYVKGIGTEEAEALVAVRTAGGPFRGIGDLARRSELATDRLEQLVRSGACDALGPRRELEWRLGLVTRPQTVRGGRQLTLAMELGDTPRLGRLSEWDELVADYETTGLSVRAHPLRLLRPGLAARGFVTVADLPVLESGTPVLLAGLTVARQRPGSAKGVVFLLVEDEHGLVNLVLYPAVYERHRLLARTEPLLEVHGTLERRDRNLNVIVERLLPLSQPGRPVIVPRQPETVPDARELPLAAGAEGDVRRLRAAAPGAHHFARGRH
jgi:error-prone DNA polymerase